MRIRSFVRSAFRLAYLCRGTPYIHPMPPGAHHPKGWVWQRVEMEIAEGADLAGWYDGAVIEEERRSGPGSVPRGEGHNAQLQKWNHQLFGWRLSGPGVDEDL
jgi:hypothetical protein